MKSIIQTFEDFLSDKGLLAEYQFNYKKIGFGVDEDKTLEQFYESHHPKNWIIGAFIWSSTFRGEDNRMDGFEFWSKLDGEWLRHYNGIPKDTPSPVSNKSIKDKLKDAITAYLEALPDDTIFYGSDLADYCLKRVNAHKYPTTVLKYMNQLKNDGVVNYFCLNRSTSKYKKLALV